MKTDWGKLNAYVDGELDATGSADVAAAIAQHPVLAAQVATLAKLKAALRESSSPVEVAQLRMIRRSTYLP